MVNKKMKLIHTSNKVAEKTNPFDLKINRKKRDIIGQRKSQSGIISKNKTRVNQKRKEFLNKIHLHKSKANNFVDKRIGEYDSEMLNEDRVMARLAESQRKQHKKSLYNLNDEFDLTHDGQPISSMEKFDDFEGDTDDEEVQLNADFVSDAHFGGFLTKKDNAPKSRKEILNEFIGESKKKKQERKEAKEFTDDLTSKLDEEWKQIHNLIPNIGNEVIKKVPCDPFDKVVNELRFEPRGTPVVSTKNAETENEKRRKILEEERLSRMNDFKKDKHCESISADALEENFLLDDMSDTIENEESNNIKDGEELILQDPDNDVSIENDSEDSSVGNLSLEEESNDSHTEDINVSSDTWFLPQTCESLCNLISNCNLEEMNLKLDSLLKKCRFKDSDDIQVSLKFFTCILEFIDCTFESEETDIALLDIVVPHLSIFIQKLPLETGKIFKKFLLEKISHFQKGKRKDLQCFSTLIILKICGYLYSTSDFHHPVTTLAMTFMSNILTSCLHTTVENIILRMFVCHIVYEYASYSKRYIPEVVNYLFSVLILASKEGNSVSKLVKQLNLHTSLSKQILCSSLYVENWKPIEFSHLLFKRRSHNINDTGVLSIIYYALILLSKYADLYKNIPVFSELFHSSITLSSFLPVENYPVKITDKIKEIEALIAKGKELKQTLTFPNKKPKVLKLFTPRFEDCYDRKPLGTSHKLKIHKQLSKKIRREEKGIIREVRRDAEFEARERLKQRVESDLERKRKVKELYAELASQERDYKNATKRK